MAEHFLQYMTPLWLESQAQSLNRRDFPDSSLYTWSCCKSSHCFNGFYSPKQGKEYLEVGKEEMEKFKKKGYIETGKGIIDSAAWLKQ